MINMLTHTVTVKGVSSRNIYNEITFDAGTPYSAHVQYKNTKIITSEGQEKIARGTVTFGEVISMDLDSQILLPNGETPQILDVVTQDGSFLLKHTKVYFA